jgi:cytochrome b-561
MVPVEQYMDSDAAEPGEQSGLLQVGQEDDTDIITQQDDQEMAPAPADQENSFVFIESMQRICIILSHALSLLAIGVVSYWVHQLGGLSVKQTGEAKLVFNWHPLLMIVAFFFMTVASLSFRHERLIRDRNTRKLIHGSAWFAAALCGLFALLAVFKSHNDNVSGLIANMYSLHSWIGAIVIASFIAQFLFGFVALGVGGSTLSTYTSVSLSPSVKASVLRIHSFVGPAVYLTTASTILLGIQEKEGFVGCSYKVDKVDTILPLIGKIPAACRSSHSLGIVVLIVALSTCFALYDFPGHMHISSTSSRRSDRRQL